MASGKIGDLFWLVNADTSKFDKALKKTDKSAKGMGAQFKTLANIIKGSMAVAAVAGVAKISMALVHAASEAEETRNKFDVVYRDISVAAEAAAENLADNFGLSGTAARSLLADTGDLLTGFGFTQESALDLSDQVNQLAVDLASFTNFSGGAKGASEALTKALLGERESVKALGISILDADVKAKVLENTQAGLTFETERQAKAYATLQIAQAQSQNAIGDFERSIDSYANQVRIAEANTQDLKEAWGEALLPLATELTKAFSGITKALADAAQENNTFKSIMKDLEDGAVDGEYSIQQLQQAMKDLFALNKQDSVGRSSDLYIEEIMALDALIIKRYEASQQLDQDAIMEEARARNKADIARIEAEEQARLTNLKLSAADLLAQRAEDALSDDEKKLRALREQINYWAEYRGTVEGAEELFQSLAAERDAIQARINEGLEDELETTKELYSVQQTQYEADVIFRQAIADAQERAAQDIRDEIELVRQLQQAYFTAGSQIGNIWNSINQIQSNVHDSELQRIQAEINATEEGSDERIALEDKYAAKKKALAIEDANRQKALGIFNASISTAQAIIGFLANPGGIPGIILSGLAGAAGVAQIAAINSQPMPAFEQGGIVPQPPGVPATGDNVMIRANPGERIVPRDEAGGQLMLMINLDGQRIAESVIDNYVNKGRIIIDSSRGLR